MWQKMLQGGSGGSGESVLDTVYQNGDNKMGVVAIDSSFGQTNNPPSFSTDKIVCNSNSNSYSGVCFQVDNTLYSYVLVDLELVYATIGVYGGLTTQSGKSYSTRISQVNITSNRVVIDVTNNTNYVTLWANNTRKLNIKGIYLIKK